MVVPDLEMKICVLRISLAFRGSYFIDISFPFPYTIPFLHRIFHDAKPKCKNPWTSKKIGGESLGDLMNNSISVRAHDPVLDLRLDFFVVLLAILPISSDVTTPFLGCVNHHNPLSRLWIPCHQCLLSGLWIRLSISSWTHGIEVTVRIRGWVFPENSSWSPCVPFVHFLFLFLYFPPDPFVRCLTFRS